MKSARLLAYAHGNVIQNTRDSAREAAVGEQQSTWSAVQ